jgi:ribosomal protein S18 acetylase RimI-like enzyme
MTDVIIEQVVTGTQEVLDALDRLIPQLTHNNRPPWREELDALLDESSSVLLVARRPDAGGRIVGAGSLGIYHVPTGIRAVIEDVIVDQESRGLGIGEALTRRLLEIARHRGARGISLTSNPRRLAANRLYVGMGFLLRETNCYYYEFE